VVDEEVRPHELISKVLPHKHCSRFLVEDLLSNGLLSKHVVERHGWRTTHVSLSCSLFSIGGVRGCSSNLFFNSRVPDVISSEVNILLFRRVWVCATSTDGFSREAIDISYGFLIVSSSRERTGGTS
jgi:hypothetical protein